jgi:phosphoglycerate dehydrogenase-like enzyme
VSIWRGDLNLKVLIADYDYADVGLERSILEGAGLEVVEAQCRTEDDVIEAGQGVSALLTQYAQISARVLAGLPELGLVVRYGVGYDIVDVEAARERGVWVANVPDYGTEEVAVHALAMALGLLRHLPLYDRDVREGRWHPVSTGPLRRLKTLTLGVVGLGRIGGTFARRASLEKVFSESAVVSLHPPLTGETRGYIDRGLFGRMREGSYLVNTARGGLMDVLPQEPPPPDHPLLRNPDVILTPHAAFYSLEAEEDVRRKAAQNVVSWAKEGRPLYPVAEGRQR